MSLAPGTRFGPYEIAAALGAGGMGEVYRARDTRLGRDVAVKILPPEMAGDPDRLRRFEQEARAASALNHPNILVLHDLGSEGRTPYLVTELLEGETLRGKLENGPPPLRKTLDWTRQIAEGLAAAHARGIVHRDLKPENVFVTNDGRVKILDFGLAKQEALGSASVLAATPTLASEGTGPGVVLGTVGYMSPEQVRGQPAGPRSDLFALGAILYELVSGRRAFQRDSAVETMSAILKEEPPELAESGRSLPVALERVVRRLLEKDPEQRFQSASDLAFDLGSLSTTSTAAAAPLRGRAAWNAGNLIRSAGLVLAGALLGGLVIWRIGPSSPGEPPSIRYFTYSGEDWNPAVSPDGKTIAFVSGRGGVQRIWMKQVTGGSEVALTDGEDYAPRFSADGSALLFVRWFPTGKSALYSVPSVGGDARRLIDDVFEADWSFDGRHLAFLRQREDSGGRSLWISSADGTDPRPLADLPAEAGLTSPRWSPDGRHIAVMAHYAATSEPSQVLLVDLASAEWRALPAHRPAIAGLSLEWKGDGREILYTQADTLSETNLIVPGWVVLQDVSSAKSRVVLALPRPPASASAIADGRLLMTVDSTRQTMREVPVGESAAVAEHRLTGGITMDRQPIYSPDGSKIVFTSTREGNPDIWQLTTSTGAVRRLTDHPAHDWDPALIAGGRQLVWSSNRAGHFEIWIAEADGSGARQLSQDGRDAENPTATPDGGWIFYSSGAVEKQGLWRIRADGSEATRLVSGQAVHPETSPDGRYVLYFNRQGAVRTLRVVDATDGQPVPFTIPDLADWRARWQPDGRGIVFRSRDETGRWGLYAQDFVANGDTSSTRRKVAGFDPRLDLETFAISPDGTRLAVAEIEWGSSLMLASGVPGVEPPRRPR